MVEIHTQMTSDVSSFAWGFVLNSKFVANLMSVLQLAKCTVKKSFVFVPIVLIRSDCKKMYAIASSKTFRFFFSKKSFPIDCLPLFMAIFKPISLSIKTMNRRLFQGHLSSAKKINTIQIDILWKPNRYWGMYVCCIFTKHWKIDEGNIIYTRLDGKM